ncbi:serine/threonine-protein kinase [Nocardiopsis kunsanensis]|uniref:serine/threonine-protein kinase n=1 Tax=Nocardiopsis kunsanensis TaxID=141693 RepID=UPI0004768136|nr:serine/threonine-protein kinase [Nocardiopsis kunsanensis]
MTNCTDPGCNGRLRNGLCGACGQAPQDVRASRPPDPPPTTPGPGGAAPGRSDTPVPGAPVEGGPPVPPQWRAETQEPLRRPPGPSAHDPAAEEWPGRPGSGPSSGEGSGSGHMRLSGRSGPGRSSGGTAALLGAGASGRSSSRPTSRGTLGMGLVQVPVVPYRDPSDAVMTDPVVAEKNRYCGNCNEKVGRRRGELPGRTQGFCRRCGTRFSFVPKLVEGDMVGGQYEVLGCLAHGGLGWVYLARDRNVNDRWVVLKGLLNSGDAEAHKAASAEREYLSQVEHPNIVKIINFAQHPDPQTGVPSGHIVMDYVGGKSLRELLLERRGSGGQDGALPLDQVIAYGLECLRALGYLHSKGLLYCDFKPDNVIQSEEQVKLIDLGGVRRMDDTESAVYSTPGYGVPEEEIVRSGPSVSSDLYSVGRALAVLSFRFSFRRRHPYTLPPRDAVPVLRRYESYDRLLRRATHPEPERRFHDAVDMAEQLTGVLREVLSDMEESPHPAPSSLFGAESFSAADLGAHDADRLLSPPPPTRAAGVLPAPVIDPADPAAQLLGGFVSLSPAELVPTLRAAPSPTPETRLMLVRALITEGRRLEAMDALHAFGQTMPGDWRTMWYMAVMELGDGEFGAARAHFDELYSHLPGELAPKLGLAMAAEHTGGHETAAELYRTVWTTDHSYVSAAFGLARIRRAQGQRSRAIEVLDTVPELSSLHVHAQTVLIALLVTGEDLRDVDDFLQAGERLGRIRLDSESGERLAARVLEGALDWLRRGGRPDTSVRLLGTNLTEEGVRTNLERRYRSLAHWASSAADRYVLVDKANSLRPKTLL